MEVAYGVTLDVKNHFEEAMKTDSSEQKLEYLKKEEIKGNANALSIVVI